MASSSDGDRPWQSYHTVYTNAKAGMEGVDKEKVQRIIYEMSKGSKYFENEKRKEAFINQKIEKLRAQFAKLTDGDMSHFQMIADKRSLEMEVSRDLSKIWLHVDMDAFYAAVETLENPLLNGKPMAVGSMSMICTANYEARKFGVRAAMPGFIARKLCPDLIIVPTNFEKYTYFSELTRKVFRKYDPDYMATSLDEAYLNMTDQCSQRHISGEEVAAELRNAIYEETGLTCSVGVAANRMLAKVCSDINKPNGQYILPNDRRAILAFVSSLPVRKIGGIGKVTELMLKDVLGITTCEEIVKKGAFLYALFSQSSSDFFLSVGLGLGGTETPKQRQRKSISSERTFPATDDELLLYQKLADIAETLSNDMQKECLAGRTLTLKLKTATFEVRTRAVSLHKNINSKEDILSSASKLLKAELPLALRLMGLRISQLYDDGNGSIDKTQMTLMNFLIKEDTNTRSSKSTCSDICDKQLVLGQESFSFDSIPLLSKDGEDGEYSLDFEPSVLLESKQLPLLENDVVTHQGDVKDHLNSDPGKESGMIEEVSEITCCGQKETASSNKDVNSFWIDDYICSVCGIELPSSFIVERQEHSDYHFAEKLQKESMQSVRNLIEGRPVVKPMQNKESSRKKRKSTQSEGIHIPIDAFFIKDKNLHAEE